MRIALAQINPLVGDLEGNADLIITACDKSIEKNSNLLLTPELSLWGYPPRDLLLSKSHLLQQKVALNKISTNLTKKHSSLNLLIGIAEEVNDARSPKLFNSIALIDKNGYKVISRKQLLPSYDVFDEKRYFRPALETGILELQSNGKLWKIGITICEDLWVEESLHKQRLSGPDPIKELISKNINLLVNLSASPFSQKKESLRRDLAIGAVKKLGCPMIYLNQVGGNDELIFDGASFVLNSKAKTVLKLPSYCEAIEIWDSEERGVKEYSSEVKPLSQEKLFQALVLGVRDYAYKCHFDTALVGLSGGIDSSLVAIIASAALGADKVTGVMMPSPWSSEGSSSDAIELAQRLGIATHKIPIQNLMASFNTALAKPLKEPPEGITAENLQSRIRGILLMALSNQEGHLLLSTGNKSELAVGYCTLYGDMNGGLSVIGDLYKTCIFDLCNWIDSPAAYDCRRSKGLPSSGSIVGRQILEKAPSAELRPGQLDTDSLPDYLILDRILKALIEEKESLHQLIEKGEDPDLVNRIQTLLKKGEFKRRQAAPVLKVSHQAFGSGWRLPIATL